MAGTGARAFTLSLLLLLWLNKWHLAAAVQVPPTTLLVCSNDQ
jgi:hypothetical protein